MQEDLQGVLHSVSYLLTHLPEDIQAIATRILRHSLDTSAVGNPLPALYAEFPRDRVEEGRIYAIHCLEFLDRSSDLPLFETPSGVTINRNVYFPYPKEQWVREGQLLQRHRPEGGDEALSEWLTSIEYLRHRAALREPVVRGMGTWVILQNVGLRKWARSAFPTVVTSHTYAAALLATKVSPAVLATVRLPWDAFVLEVPDGLLPLTRVPLKNPLEPGEYFVGNSEIRRILVTCLDPLPGKTGPRVGLVAHADGGNLWRFGEMNSLVKEEGAGADLAPVTGMDSADERLGAAVGLFVVNACLAMSSPENLTRLSGSSPKGNKKGNKRGSPEPVHLHYKLGAPVTIDLRREVREYLLGRRRSSPTVQTLVSGHWKLQHHGPQRSLAKTLWIQPYWRGPEDAPILVRPHHLGVNA